MLSFVSITGNAKGLWSIFAKTATPIMKKMEYKLSGRLPIRTVSPRMVQQAARRIGGDAGSSPADLFFLERRENNVQHGHTWLHHRIRDRIPADGRLDKEDPAWEGQSGRQMILV